MRRALALLAVAACSGHGPQQIGAQPSWRHETAAASAGSAGSTGSAAPEPVAPVTFAPSSRAVARYNEPVKAPPHTPLGDATIAAVREAAAKAGMPPPVADARLFEVCAEIAQLVPKEGSVDSSLIDFALRHNGMIEPIPRLVVIWDRADAVDEIIQQLRPRIAENLAAGEGARVGIAAGQRSADGTSAIVLALQGSSVTTNPIPRTLSRGGSTLLEAVVDAKYRDPEVFVTREDGATELVTVDAGKSGSFKAQLACGKHTGRQQVEITATGALGAVVLANFPVWCGVEPPTMLTVEPSRDDVTVPADQAERRLLALMNRDRGAAGLAALVWDDRVAEVARKYSEEMRRTKVVAHVSPTTGSVGDRLKAAGLKSSVMLENVALAYSVGEAHRSLMNSPGHRANVMSPLATHVGVGVVLGDEESGARELYLTQVFTRIPPKIDGAKAIALVRERIAKVRPVLVSVGLSSVAQQLADGLAAGKPRDALMSIATKQIDAISGAYQRVGSAITVVADLDSVDGKQLLGDDKPDEIGIGIAQGTHPDIGDGAVWIVVLMAERLQAPPQQQQRKP